MAATTTTTTTTTTGGFGSCSSYIRNFSSSSSSSADDDDSLLSFLKKYLDVDKNDDEDDETDTETIVLYGRHQTGYYLLRVGVVLSSLHTSWLMWHVSGYYMPMMMNAPDMVKLHIIPGGGWTWLGFACVCQIFLCGYPTRLISQVSWKKKRRTGDGNIIKKGKKKNKKNKKDELCIYTHRVLWVRPELRVPQFTVTIGGDNETRTNNQQPKHHELPWLVDPTSNLISSTITKGADLTCLRGTLTVRNPKKARTSWLWRWTSWPRYLLEFRPNLTYLPDPDLLFRALMHPERLVKKKKGGGGGGGRRSSSAAAGPAATLSSSHPGRRRRQDDGGRHRRGTTGGGSAKKKNNRKR